MGTRLIFGCGYLGKRVASRWLECGHDVFVSTRSNQRADDFSKQGLRPIVCDITEPTSLANLPSTETVLFAVGFDRTSGRSISEVYGDGLRNVLHALPSSIQRMIYISSTGVYSQDDGQWVNEDSTCQPKREGGKACLAAEQLLANHPIGAKTNVLRLAGIYGPERVPRLNDVKAGKPLAAPSHGHLNLIHVDDAADIAVAVDQRAAVPRTYLVSDGHPVLRREYYCEIARLLGANEPQFTEPADQDPAAQRAASDKRISNQRLLDELHVSFRYPSYREGLTELLR